MTNIITEHLETTYLIEDIALIDEGFADVLKRLSPSRLKSKIDDIKNAIKKRDLSALKKFKMGLSFSKIDKICSKHISDYDSKKNKAERELNKQKPPQKLIKPLSASLALVSKDEDSLNKSLTKLSRIDTSTWNIFTN